MKGGFLCYNKVMWYWLTDLFRGIQFGSRSPQWSSVRNKFLKDNPVCAVCGTKGSFTNGLEVHHLQDFSHHPELELELRNLIVLCRRDHLIFGHLSSWKSINKNCLEDCEIWNQRIKDRP